MTIEKNQNDLIDITVDIVASYVSNNTIPKDQMSELINIVYDSFNKHPKYLSLQYLLKKALPMIILFAWKMVRNSNLSSGISVRLTV